MEKWGISKFQHWLHLQEMVAQYKSFIFKIASFVGRLEREKCGASFTQSTFILLIFIQLHTLQMKTSAPTSSDVLLKLGEGGINTSLKLAEGAN